MGSETGREERISEDTEKEEGLGVDKDRTEADCLCVCVSTSVHLQSVWFQGDLCHTFRERENGYSVNGWFHGLIWPRFFLVLHRYGMVDSNNALLQGEKQDHVKRTKSNPLSIIGLPSDTSVPYSKCTHLYCITTTQHID